jgi:hypothetical protein
MAPQISEFTRRNIIDDLVGSNAIGICSGTGNGRLMRASATASPAAIPSTRLLVTTATSYAARRVIDAGRSPSLQPVSRAIVHGEFSRVSRARASGCRFLHPEPLGYPVARPRTIPRLVWQDQSLAAIRSHQVDFLGPADTSEVQVGGERCGKDTMVRTTATLPFERD